MEMGQDMIPVRQGGFTLIEMMIVVAIIAILAAIALPSYQEHIRKGHRAAAQSEMMDIANREQQFLLANRAYADKPTLEANGYGLPSAVGAKYTYAITPNNGVNPPTFLITFTPAGSQTADGNLTLDSAGAKKRAGDTSKW